MLGTPPFRITQLYLQDYFLFFYYFISFNQEKRKERKAKRTHADPVRCLDNCYRFEVSAHICLESVWTSASFHMRCFGQGFAYTEVSIFPRTEGLVSWVFDYMVVVVMGMKEVSDLWLYKKGSKQFILFIASCKCIGCAFKTHRIKHRCELTTATLWVEFLSHS